MVSGGPRSTVASIEDCGSPDRGSIPLEGLHLFFTWRLYLVLYRCRYFSLWEIGRKISVGQIVHSWVNRMVCYGGFAAQTSAPVMYD